MAKTFTYKRKSVSEEDHAGVKPCCGNCDLMDYFITTREAQMFAEGGSSKAFKNDRGEVLGSDADRLKTFCVRTGASVRPDGHCGKHVWAKDAWVNPNDEKTLC